MLGGISGNGGGGDLAGKLIVMSEQLKAATGVDMVQAVRERLVGKPVSPVRAGTEGAEGGRREAGDWRWPTHRC